MVQRKKNRDTRMRAEGLVKELIARLDKSKTN